MQSWLYTQPSLQNAKWEKKITLSYPNHSFIDAHILKEDQDVQSMLMNF